MGDFTIKQVLQFTKQSNTYNNRFEYAKRDKVKTLRIKEIKTLDPNRPGRIKTKYLIESRSKPNYYPYRYRSKKKDGSKGRYRRRNIEHQYDIVLEVDRLSINSINWRLRVGSLKKVRKPPQREIKQIYTETKEKWIKRYGEKETKERIAKHKRKKRLYLNEGDWLARKLGIFLDGYYRQYVPLYIHDHLYGRLYNTEIPKKAEIFFDKHTIAMIDVLLRANILKDN